jgi:hypothetical protein
MSKLLADVKAKLAKMDTATDEGKQAAIAFVRNAREDVNLEAHAKRDEARALSRILLDLEGRVDYHARARRRGTSASLVESSAKTKKPSKK